MCLCVCVCKNFPRKPHSREAPVLPGATDVMGRSKMSVISLQVPLKGVGHLTSDTPARAGGGGSEGPPAPGGRAPGHREVSVCGPLAGEAPSFSEKVAVKPVQERPHTDVRIQNSSARRPWGAEQGGDGSRCLVPSVTDGVVRGQQLLGLGSRRSQGLTGVGAATGHWSLRDGGGTGGRTAWRGGRSGAHGYGRGAPGTSLVPRGPQRAPSVSNT